MFIVPISKLPSIGSIGEVNPIQPPEKSGGIPFADVLADAVKTARETEAISQQSAYDLSMGNMDDLHTMQINSSKAAAAMEFTVELTTRAVNAYNEVLRMQI